MILVIAFKFNDIIYSLSTTEYQCAKIRYLIILYNSVNPEDFPYISCFDKVYFVKYKKSVISLSIAIIKILFKVGIKVDCIITSNPILVIIQFIIKRVRAREVVIIEDGLMNYRNFSPNNNLKKKVALLFLNIKYNQIFDKITCTYLLSPQKAIFFWGKKKRLDFYQLKNSDENVKLQSLENKSFFVGQNLYDTGYVTKTEYKNIVERIMKAYNIDYYIPHPHSAKDENLNVPLFNLSQINTTLEICAIYYSFTIYSISSSVLYTTKNINPNIKSYMVNISETENKPSILKEYCDKIIIVK